MSGRVVLLVLGDVFVGETREIIVGLVVLAHVVEAEAMILALVPAALRSRIKSRLLAAFRLALRTHVAQDAVLVGLDAQAVEEFRVELHGISIMGSCFGHDKNGSLVTN